MKKTTKLMTLALVSVLAISLFAGCSKKPAVDVDANASGPLIDIANKIYESQEFSMMMETTDEEMLKESFGLDTSRYKEYAAYVPMMTTSNTIVIVEANNKDDIPTIEAELKARHEAIKKSFESYLPDQGDLAKKGQVLTKGRYAMLIIAPDTEAAIKIFNEEIK